MCLFFFGQDLAADCVQIDRLLYFGRNFLCGLDHPVLKLQFIAPSLSIMQRFIRQEAYDETIARQEYSNSPVDRRVHFYNYLLRASARLDYLFQLKQIQVHVGWTRDPFLTKLNYIQNEALRRRTLTVFTYVPQEVVTGRTTMRRFVMKLVKEARNMRNAIAHLDLSPPGQVKASCSIWQGKRFTFTFTM